MLKNKTFIVGVVAGAGVAAAALAGAGAPWPGAFAQAPAEAIRPTGQPMFSPPPGAPMSFADIFDRVSPAVVSPSSGLAALMCRRCGWRCSFTRSGKMANGALRWCSFGISASRNSPAVSEPESPPCQTLSPNAVAS